MRDTQGPARRGRASAAALVALALLLIPARSVLAGGEQEQAFPTPETAVQTQAQTTAGPQTADTVGLRAANTVEDGATPYETVSPRTQLDFPMDAVAAPQSIDGTVPMFRHAYEDSEVLMEYYSGARLTALHPAGGGFWKVQAGVKGAGIMGYMRAEDLRFGTSAQREVTVCYMELRFNQDTPVYAYRDTGSKVIGTCDTEHTYYAMSRTDSKWVQLFLPPLPHAAEQEDRMTEGFVHMETGLGRGYFHQRQRLTGYASDAWSWAVDPLPGEMTQEGAIAYAIDLLAFLDEMDLDYYANLMEDGAPAAFFDAESLREMHSSAALNHYDWYSAEGETWQRWYVFFWSDLDEGVMWVTIENVDGRGEPRYYFSYVEPDDFSIYAIDIIL